MNPLGVLIEMGVTMALGRMQRPAGHALVQTGRVLKQVGQEIEDAGHDLIRTAAPATHFTAGAPAR